MQQVVWSARQPTRATVEALLSGGRYRLKRRIVSGTLAEVFEAHLVADGGFERRVLLKCAAPGLVWEQAAGARLIDEATIASALHHANIASVIDFGVMDGRPFLVAEWVDGLDLAELRTRASEQAEPIPPEVVLHIVAEIAHALDYAHRSTGQDGRLLEVVHRDVTPDNVMVSWDGDVKLTDFGIAFAAARHSKSQLGSTLGKVEFMSPEHKAGMQVDGRADIYSLGRVLEELLAESLDDDSSAIVTKATQQRREDRYERGRDMAAACGAALVGRLQLDARTTLREYVTRFRSKETHAAQELFDVDLLLDDAPGPLRRFSTVGASSTLSATDMEMPTDPESGIAVGTTPTEIPTVAVDTRLVESASKVATRIDVRGTVVTGDASTTVRPDVQRVTGRTVPMLVLSVLAILLAGWFLRSGSAPRQEGDTRGPTAVPLKAVPGRRAVPSMPAETEGAEATRPLKRRTRRRPRPPSPKPQPAKKEAPGPDVQALLGMLAELRPKVARAPPSRRRDLEVQYLDLRTAVTSGLSDTQRLELAVKIRAFRRNLD